MIETNSSDRLAIAARLGFIAIEAEVFTHLIFAYQGMFYRYKYVPIPGEIRTAFRVCDANFEKIRGTGLTTYASAI